MCTFSSQASPPSMLAKPSMSEARPARSALTSVPVSTIPASKTSSMWKSCRASLIDGFASIDGGEAWLENVHIPEYTEGTWTNHAPRRKRKLLLHAWEIKELAVKTRERGSTMVPLSLYFLDGRAKVEIALARGKKDYDKRQTLREQQDTREAQRAMGTRRHD